MVQSVSLDCRFDEQTDKKEGEQGTENNFIHRGTPGKTY